MVQEVKIEANAPALRGAPTRGGMRGVRGQTRIPQRKPTVIFVGKCKELKGYIFDSSDQKQADKYPVAKRELAEYMGRTGDYSADIKRTIENETRFIVPRVAALSAGEAQDPMAVRIREKRIDACIRRDKKLTEKMMTAYSVTLGQCTEACRRSLRDCRSGQQSTSPATCWYCSKQLKELCINFGVESNKYTP
mmetsp:Transcript_26396/g.78060  ORF Transcript_26396/g.78060 Transcript_26396/m.78060 type:complete len:193 (+) Transcript_26396:135-713(+)